MHGRQRHRQASPDKRAADVIVRAVVRRHVQPRCAHQTRQMHCAQRKQRRPTTHGNSHAEVSERSIVESGFQIDAGAPRHR